MPVRHRVDSVTSRIFDPGRQDQRLTNLEDAVSGIRESLADISKRLDTKPTNWWQVIGGVVGLLTLIGAFLYQGQQPVSFELARHDRELEKLFDDAALKSDLKTSEDLSQRRSISVEAENVKTRDELEKARIDLARTQGASEERHAEYLRNYATLSARIDGIDGNLIKRPEIESLVSALRGQIDSTNTGLNDRISAVISSVNELRHDWGSSFTIGDVIKDIQDRLNQMPQPLPAK